MGYGADRFTKMLGRKLAKVSAASGGERVEFEFQDGFKKSFIVTGDCCSSSWVEHLTVPTDIVGATLLSVEDSGGEDVTADDEKNPIRPGSDYREHECLQVYQTRFRTDRGDVILEYRNSSNGYYGGSLDEAGESE